MLTLHAQAQDQTRAVEKLYAAALYEDALKLLDQSQTVLGDESPESTEYRILCLWALGDTERARLAIEKLVLKHPMHRPDPARFSPGRQEQFELVRRRVLPQIIQAKYTDARASFVAKTYDDAAQRLEALLELLQTVENDPQYANTQNTASDFLDLARLAAARIAAANNRGTSAGMTKDSRATIYDISYADVVAPVPLKPILPPSSESSVATVTSGLFEIVVDETGRVESASFLRSISSQYDAVVIEQSRSWRFKPATYNGQPVRFRKLIEIYTAPLPPQRR